MAAGVRQLWLRSARALSTARATHSAMVPSLQMDHPLTLDAFLYRAEKVTHKNTIVSAGVCSPPKSTNNKKTKKKK